MVEILPIRLLVDEDAPIYGVLSVSLGKLQRANFPVANGIAITAPNLKLKTVLEQYNFGTKEVFEQSLTLVKKEIKSVSVPPLLIKEAGKHKRFLLNGRQIKGVKELWTTLLDLWLDQIKAKLWGRGFHEGITDNLEVQIVIFTKKVQGFGRAFFDPLQDDVEISVKWGKPHPKDLQKISEIVKAANKKLFIPHEYEWIIDEEIKLTRVLPYTPTVSESIMISNPVVAGSQASPCEAKSAVKVFFELSSGFAIEKNVDGIYIASEKIFDLNLPSQSFDNLVFKLVESAITFPDSPIFFKLADKSEGMGKVRGSLRLLHQKSLLDPLIEALDFARHKKGLNNIHVVIPYVRGVNELLQIKRELAIKKLMRKSSFQLWMEVAVPENIINMEDYLIAGVDGVVLNLNELIAHLNGFDPLQDDLSFYKNEVTGLLKFLEDGIRLLHKSKIPFIAFGNITFYPKVLEFLVEKGVYGVVAERFEAHSAKDLLYQTEKRMVLRRS